MQGLVATGGAELEGFARISGLTSEQFVESFERDATGAIITFVEGLGRFQASGGKAATVFDELKIEGVRLKDVLQRMALNSDGLRESVERGNTAFRENTALTEEAAKRYETTESKLTLLKGAVSALAIEIGSGLSPAIGGTASVFAGWLNSLRDSLTAITQLDNRLRQTARAEALIEALRAVGVEASITATESLPEFISRLEEMAKVIFSEGVTNKNAKVLIAIFDRLWPKPIKIQGDIDNPIAITQITRQIVSASQDPDS